MEIGWKPILEWIWSHLVAIGVTLGFGSGVGAVKLLLYVPSPKVSNRVGACFFDWIQDMASNRDRIGERLADDGSTVFIERPHRATVQSVNRPAGGGVSAG